MYDRLLVVGTGRRMALAKEIGRCEQLSRVWCDLAHGSSMAVLTATARPQTVSVCVTRPSHSAGNDS